MGSVQIYYYSVGILFDGMVNFRKTDSFFLCLLIPETPKKSPIIYYFVKHEKIQPKLLTF